MHVHKGKIKLIPWSRQKEKEYKGETGIVLASGPLMLKDGQICDWNSCGTNFIRTKHPHLLKYESNVPVPEYSLLRLAPVHRMMESSIILVIMGGLTMLGSVRCLIFFIFINTTL